jgi:hypothetical protein
VSVAFEVLRLGRAILERDGRWSVAPDRESLPLPSVVVRWGRLLDQPRPEIERVYAGVRRVIGTADLSETLRSDQDPGESVQRRVLLVCEGGALASLVEQQVRRLGVEPVLADVDDMEAAEKVRAGVASALVVVPAEHDLSSGPAPVARPNALFQWGMLAGRYGRTSVCALVAPGVVLPASLSVQRHIPLDPEGGWAIHLAAELGPTSSR